MGKTRKHAKRTKRPKSWLARYRDPYGGTDALSTAVPNEMYTVLKYCDLISLNPGVGGLPDTYIYRANNIFDPDYSGVGHQPRGHDELQTLYTMYEVQFATIRVTALNSDNTSAQIVALQVRNSITTGSVIQDSVESSNAKWMGVGARNADGGKSIYMTCKPAKYLGASLKDDSLVAPFGAGPNDQAYFHITGFSADSADSGAINCLVEVKYYCRLFEPERLAIS